MCGTVLYLYCDAESDALDLLRNGMRPQNPKGCARRAACKESTGIVNQEVTINKVQDEARALQASLD